MKHGFIKVKAFSPELRVADIKFNTAKIIQAIWDSAENGVKVLVLPELCVCGASCGDLLLQPALLDACEIALDDIRASSEGKDIVVFVGAPLRGASAIYNCAVAICNGEILGVFPKTTPSSYTGARDSRYFSSLATDSEVKICKQVYSLSSECVLECESMPSLKIGVVIGDDALSFKSFIGGRCQDGATVIAHLDSRCALVGSYERKVQSLVAQSAKYKCAIVSASAGEGETSSDMLFAPHNIICENGEILTQSGPFSSQNGECVSEIDTELLTGARATDASVQEFASTTPFSLKSEKTTLTRKIDAYPFVSGDKDTYEFILTVQARALAKRLVASHSKTAVLGISGGLDSTLALLVLCRATDYLGWEREKIHAITMPCFGTTKRTKSNATLLCESLGVTFKEINIADSVRLHFKDIGHSEDDHSVTFENAQARERTQILMDYANRTGGLVVGTGDLSEIALGWSTYNADHMSMYNPNCDIPKTLVRHLVYHEAMLCEGECRDILSDILDTPVSPELLPPDENGQIEQKTEDLVGPYELHDFFIYNFVRRRFAPSKIYRLAKYAFDGKFDEQTIYKWLGVFIKRFFTQQFKRSCSPDGVKVGSVSLSPRGEFLMPSDATSWVWLDELEANKDY